jgi:hypothetical protein
MIPFTFQQAFSFDCFDRASPLTVSFLLSKLAFQMGVAYSAFDCTQLTKNYRIRHFLLAIVCRECSMSLVPVR